jgi:hypothetical protein
MRHVLSLLARLLLSLLTLYGVVLGLSLVLRPPDATDEPLDTSRAGSSLFSTEPKYVFLARSRLSNPEDKVIVLGASNAMAGLKQRELAPLLPTWRVHNLAVGGSNMTQVEQIAELARDAQPQAALRRNIFVIGLWYGLFAADAARWQQPGRHPGDTDIDIERYRYGFYRRAAGGPAALLPPAWLSAGVTAIHPTLVLDEWARNATSSIRRRLKGRAPVLSDAERNARVISTREQQEYLAFWQKYTASAKRVDPAQLAVLRRTVNELVAAGARVLLVELPIPSWHTRGSELARDYQRQLDALLPELDQQRGVSVSRLTDADADADFSDEVHPKPRVSPAWAARVATGVAQLNAEDAVASY